MAVSWGRLVRSRPTARVADLAADGAGTPAAVMPKSIKIMQRARPPPGEAAPSPAGTPATAGVGGTSASPAPPGAGPSTGGEGSADAARQLSIEEREEAYERARARIFGEMGSTSASEATSPSASGASTPALAEYGGGGGGGGAPTLVPSQVHDRALLQSAAGGPTPPPPTSRRYSARVRLCAGAGRTLKPVSDFDQVTALACYVGRPGGSPAGARRVGVATAAPGCCRRSALAVRPPAAARGRRRAAAAVRPAAGGARANAVRHGACVPTDDPAGRAAGAFGRRAAGATAGPVVFAAAASAAGRPRPRPRPAAAAAGGRGAGDGIERDMGRGRSGSPRPAAPACLGPARCAAAVPPAGRGQRVAGARARPAGRRTVDGPRAAADRGPVRGPWLGPAVLRAAARAVPAAAAATAVARAVRPERAAAVVGPATVWWRAGRQPAQLAGPVRQLCVAACGRGARRAQQRRALRVTRGDGRPILYTRVRRFLQNCTGQLWESNVSRSHRPAPGRVVLLAARGVVVHAVAGVVGLDTLVVLSAVPARTVATPRDLALGQSQRRARAVAPPHLAVVGVHQVGGALRQCRRRFVAVRQRFQDVHAALPVQHLRALPAVGPRTRQCAGASVNPNGDMRPVRRRCVPCTPTAESSRRGRGRPEPSPSLGRAGAPPLLRPERRSSTTKTAVKSRSAHTNQALAAHPWQGRAPAGG